jgi:hypothetical protein
VFRNPLQAIALQIWNSVEVRVVGLQDEITYLNKTTFASLLVVAMKLSSSLLAASAVCLFAATAATAFTIGPQTAVTKANSQAVTSPASRLSSTTLKMSAAPDTQTVFAKSEIESNVVRGERC